MALLGILQDHNGFSCIGQLEDGVAAQPKKMELSLWEGSRMLTSSRLKERKVIGALLCEPGWKGEETGNLCPKLKSAKDAPFQDELLKMHQFPSPFHFSLYLGDKLIGWCPSWTVWKSSVFWPTYQSSVVTFLKHTKNWALLIYQEVFNSFKFIYHKWWSHRPLEISHFSNFKIQHEKILNKYLKLHGSLSQVDCKNQIQVSSKWISSVWVFIKYEILTKSHFKKSVSTKKKIWLIKNKNIKVIANEMKQRINDTTNKCKDWKY